MSEFSFNSHVGQEHKPKYLERRVNTALSVFSSTRALEEFEARFPQIMDLFGRVGIHPSRPKSLFNPYTGQDSREYFSNIGEHCLAVGFAAARIVEALVRAGTVQESQATAVIERALIHDITKPYEIMRRDAKKAGLAEEAYTVSAYQKLYPLLVEIGISEPLAKYLTEAGTETGHNSLKNFIVLDGSAICGLVAGRIAEKIVHLADDMTFSSTPRHAGDVTTTMFLTPWERMLASGFIEKYPWLWKEGLGVQEAGEIVALADIRQPDPGVSVIGDYAALQVEIARMIARELQLLIDPTSEHKQEPEQFIKDLINNRI